MDRSSKGVITLGLPRVSARTAKLDAKGSVQAVSNASIDELRTVEGIGPKRAKEIHETFRAGLNASS